MKIIITNKHLQDNEIYVYDTEDNMLDMTIYSHTGFTKKNVVTRGMTLTNDELTEFYQLLHSKGIEFESINIKEFYSRGYKDIKSLV